MTIYAYRYGAPLLVASLAAAASLMVAAEQMHTPGLRTVAASPADASQDNFRSAAVRHGADATESVTVCPFSGDPTDAELFRIPIEPAATNGLESLSRLMVDKIITVAKSRVGKQIRRLDDEDVVRLNRAVVVFLGLAGSS